MATGQEQNVVQIADLLLKYGSLILNLILGLVIYIYNRELKHHSTVHQSLDKVVSKEFEAKNKDIEALKDDYEKNCDSVHESFQNISRNIKEERSFWQEFFNSIKENIDELYSIANSNRNQLSSLQTEIATEIKRLDEKIQSLKDLLMYRKNGNSDANKS